MRCDGPGCALQARGDVDAEVVRWVSVPAHHCRQCRGHCALAAYLLERAPEVRAGLGVTSLTRERFPWSAV